MAFMILWTVVNIAVAFAYGYAKKEPGANLLSSGSREDFAHGDWHTNVLQCFREPRLLIFTCFFPAVRWAENMRLANLCRFWMAFVILLLLMDLSMSGFWYCVPMLIAIGVCSRQAVRKMFNIPHGTWRTILADTFLYSFCCVLPMVQEAQQLEE